MLLDDLMPRYDVVERHQTTVRATAPMTYAAIREADIGGGPVPRALLALRAAPAALVASIRSPREAFGEFAARRADRTSDVRLADFERTGFRVIAERAPQELVIGLLGRFWTPRGGICDDVSPATFAAPVPAGHALAGWNFTVTQNADGSSRLGTETRVLCAPDARWKFRLYWLAVQPGSGLIRRAMLRAIRLRAEGRTSP